MMALGNIRWLRAPRLSPWGAAWASVAICHCALSVIWLGEFYPSIIRDWLNHNYYWLHTQGPSLFLQYCYRYEEHPAFCRLGALHYAGGTLLLFFTARAAARSTELIPRITLSLVFAFAWSLFGLVASSPWY